MEVSAYRCFSVSLREDPEVAMRMPTIEETSRIFRFYNYPASRNGRRVPLSPGKFPLMSHSELFFE